MEIMGETEAQVEGNKWRQEQKRMSVINPDVNLFHLHQVHQETKANSLERKLSKMKPGSLLSNRSRPQKKKEQGRDCSWLSHTFPLTYIYIYTLYIYPVLWSPEVSIFSSSFLSFLSLSHSSFMIYLHGNFRYVTRDVCICLFLSSKSIDIYRDWTTPTSTRETVFFPLQVL